MDKRKVYNAIKILQSIPKGEIVELSYSGGKDSDVILKLAKMAGIKFRAIYRNTTIDPPGTLRHVKEMGVEIREPSKTFADVLAEKGIPSRYMRVCCYELKEFKILDRAILGIRRDESYSREHRYKEPEICRAYSAKEKVIQYFPILDWTRQDVEDFIKEHNIKCAPVYYDEFGNFHPERRLGCLCCPMASKRKRLEEFKKYPNMVKLYCKGGQKWLDKHKDGKTINKYKDVYSLFVRLLFFDKDEEFFNSQNAMFQEGDSKKFLEDYFGIKF